MEQLLLPGLDPVPFQVAANPDYTRLPFVYLMCPVCFPHPVRIKRESSFVHGLVTLRKNGRKHYACKECSFEYTMPDEKDAKQVWGDEIVAKLKRQWGKESYLYLPWSQPPYQMLPDGEKA